MANILRRAIQHHAAGALVGTAGATGAARLFSFLLFVAAARILDVPTFAGLFFIVATSQLMAQLGALGWTNLVRRMIPRFSDDAGLRRGFIERSFQIPAVVTTLIAGAMLAIGLAQPQDAELKDAIVFTALVLPIVTLCLLLRSYLIALARPAAGIFTGETVPIAITLFLLIVFQANTLSEVAIYYFTAYCIAIIIEVTLTRQQIWLSLKNAVPRYETIQWGKIAGFMFLGFGGKTLMDRTDTLLLAPLRGMDELAQYGAATRLTVLLVFIPTVLLAVFGTKMSEAFHAGDKIQIRQMIQLQLAIIIITLLPIAIALALYPEAILSFTYGSKYTKAASIMHIVLLAQIVFSISLPFSSLLIMTRGEKAYALAGLAGLLVNFASGVPLILNYGFVGAAYATLAGIVVMAVIFIWSSIPILRA